MKKKLLSLLTIIFSLPIILATGIVPARTSLFVKKQKGGLFAIEDSSRTTGVRIYVHSGTGSDATGYGYSPDTPVATLDYAIGLCTANQGDIIYVMPGHAESISAATSLVIDVASIKIIGLGYGANRPKLTFSTADTATISVTAANVTIENIQFYADYPGGIAVGITLAATADGFRLINCRAEEAANTKEFLIFISVAAACHDVGIDGLDFFGVDGGSDTQCIIFAGASNYSFVRNSRIYGDFSGAVIDALTAASLYMHFANLTLINIDTAAGLSLSVKSDTTGFAHDLRIAQLRDTVAPAGAALAWSEVYVTNALGAQGIYKPAVDS